MKRADYLLKIVTWILALHMCAIGAWAAPCAAREQIRSLLKVVLREEIAAGVKIPEAEELNCPSVLSNAESLAVASVRQDSLMHALAVRFECARAGCLPFIVRIDAPDGIGATQTGDGVSNRSKPLAGEMRNQHSMSASHSLVRPGEIVTLLWEQGQMRITRTMVCLDRGKKDQWVRTRAREGGRTVRARVISAGMVKAEP